MTKTQEIASEFVKRYPTLFKEDTEWWTERIVELLVGEFEHIREQAAKIAELVGEVSVGNEDVDFAKSIAASIRRMTPP